MNENWIWVLELHEDTEDGPVLYRQVLAVPAGAGVKTHRLGWFEEMRQR